MEHEEHEQPEEHEEQVAPWITGQIATLSRQSNEIDTRWGYHKLSFYKTLHQDFLKKQLTLNCNTLIYDKISRSNNCLEDAKKYKIVIDNVSQTHYYKGVATITRTLLELTKQAGDKPISLVYDTKSGIRNATVITTIKRLNGRVCGWKRKLKNTYQDVNILRLLTVGYKKTPFTQDHVKYGATQIICFYIHIEYNSRTCVAESRLFETQDYIAPHSA